MSPWPLPSWRSPVRGWLRIRTTSSPTSPVAKVRERWHLQGLSPSPGPYPRPPFPVVSGLPSLGFVPLQGPSIAGFPATIRETLTVPRYPTKRDPAVFVAVLSGPRGSTGREDAAPFRLSLTERTSEPKFGAMTIGHEASSPRHERVVSRVGKTTSTLPSSWGRSLRSPAASSGPRPRPCDAVGACLSEDTRGSRRDRSPCGERTRQAASAHPRRRLGPSRVG